MTTCAMFHSRVSTIKQDISVKKNNVFGISCKKVNHNQVLPDRQAVLYMWSRLSSM